MPSRARLSLGELAVFIVAEAVLIVKKPRTYLRAQRRARSFGRIGFYAFPRSCDEKFHWRKVFDRAPVFIRLSDKLDVREWYKEVGCKLPTTDVVWVGQSTRDLPAEIRHSDGFLKSNHASGQTIQLAQCDLSEDRLDEITQRWLAEDFGRRASEWGYSGVQRKLFVEKRAGDKDRPLEDWKFYTFGSSVERIVILTQLPEGRGGRVLEGDSKGGFIFSERTPNAADFSLVGPIPAHFDALLEEARRLGGLFDHMRVDFLVTRERAYLGEMTIYNQSGWIGTGGGDPGSRLSRAWDIRKSWFLTSPRRNLFSRFYAHTLRRALDRLDHGAG